MKHTTSERDPQTITRLRELIENIAIAMVTTVTPGGALRSRPMATSEFRAEEGELWFIMSEESRKARDLSEEHTVNVSYADPHQDRYVSVSGMATMVHDRDKLRELWEPALDRYFPRGLDDPHLVLMRVRITSAHYWEPRTGKMIPIEHPEATGAGHHTEKIEDTKVEIRSTPASG